MHLLHSKNRLHHHHHVDGGITPLNTLFSKKLIFTNCFQSLDPPPSSNPPSPDVVNSSKLHRILLAVLGGEDEDDVGADLLDQGGCGDVLLDELGQGVDWEPVKAQYGDLIHNKSATQTSYCRWTG